MKPAFVRRVLLHHLALTSFLLPALASSSQCYFPNHAPAPDVPCNTSAPVAHCCGGTDWCMENGYCLHLGIITRGSCTDRNWGDGCPAECRSDNPGGGNGINACNADGELYTCTVNQEQTECTDDNEFSLPGGWAFMLRTENVAGLGYSTPISISATGVLSAPVPTNSHHNKITGSSQATQATGVSESTFEATAAGIAAPLGVLLILSLVLNVIFLRKMKKSRERRTAMTEGGNQPNLAYDGYEKKQVHPGYAQPSRDYSQQPGLPSQHRALYLQELRPDEHPRRHEVWGGGEPHEAEGHQIFETR